MTMKKAQGGATYEEESDGRIKDNVESVSQNFNLGKEKRGWKI